MDSLLGIILIILTIILIDRVYQVFNKRSEKTRIELDVLKVLSKHECFGLFKDAPAQFEKWAAKFFALKGYTIYEVTRAQKDGSKDLILKDKSGNTIYVACKLADPGNWDMNIDLPVAQKLVGAMVADAVKKGLILTTASLTDNAIAYLGQVNSRGYEVKYIDGDALVTELYGLREAKLPGIMERLGMRFMK